MEDLLLFEFREDIKYYYNNGPYHDIVMKMTQPIIEVGDNNLLNGLKGIF